MVNGRPDQQIRGRRVPENTGNGPSILPLIVLLTVYLLYLIILVIVPLISEGMEDSLENSFPQLYRLIGAGVLFLILTVAGLIIYGKGLSGPKPGQATRKPVPPINTPGPTPSKQTVTKFKPLTQRGPPGVSPKMSGTDEPVKKAEQPKVKDDKKQDELIVFPRFVEGGIFGDTLIRIDDGKVLKIRSQVVEPRYLK